MEGLFLSFLVHNTSISSFELGIQQKMNILSELRVCQQLFLIINKTSYVDKLVVIYCRDLENINMDSNH